MTNTESTNLDQPAEIDADSAPSPAIQDQPGREAGAEDGAANNGSDAKQRLIEEGDVAADYLEELLDIADMDGDIDISVSHGRASLAIISEEESAELGALVGKDAEVLEALQDLTRLAVQAVTGERSRLMLDINGHRAKRRDELTAKANEAIDEVLSTGQEVSLEPMNPFERKVVHDVVTERGLHSSSDGAEPSRYVVIAPAS